MSEERLQKLIARAGVASRRRAEELIEAGEVTVNGRVAQLGEKADPAVDAIKVRGRRLTAPPPAVYIVINKPAGCVSTVSDPEGRPTVLDLVPGRLRRALKPVGRLDYQSEGLMLLTTDGEWAQRIAHPRHGSVKTYEVKVKGQPDDKALERLRRGMWIDGKRTSPAEVRPLRTTKGGGRGNTWLHVGLSEGMNRQIREMFFRVGFPVQRLRRVAIGRFRDDRLEKGTWRELTVREVEILAQGGAPKRAAKPGGGRSRKPKGGTSRRGDERGAARGPKRGPKSGPKSGKGSGPKRRR